MKYYPLLLALLCVSICISCISGKDSTLATSEILKFHQMVNYEQFKEIYDNSSDELKKEAGEGKFVDLIRSIHTKFGDVKTSTFVSLNVTVGTNGETLTMQQNTVFARGKGMEKFVYRFEHNKLLLSGYWLQSNDFIN